jgi:hypothetical protein
MRPTQEKPASELEGLIKALHEAVRKHRSNRPSLREPPATEEIFREVWSVWNLLPADCAADYRVSLLKCPSRDFPSFHKWLSGQRKRLACGTNPHPEAVSDKFLKAFKQDNAPVFSEFRWHTEAVLDVAARKFNDHDKKWILESPESLTQFCSRTAPRIKLGLHRARYADETARFAQPHKCLLTDPPLVIR